MNRNRRKKKKALLILFLSLIVLVSAFIAYRFIAFNLWITSDAGVLQPYPRVLILNEIMNHDNELILDKNIAGIEEAIINANSQDRIVLNLSRSDIRFNLLRTKSYVKVFLQTAIPNDRSKTTCIKFLNILTRRNDGWKVRSTQDISIE
ncbi:hypothetical protein JW926_04285 [Candidatus Sumerlaeota bacterium]|nr:hypothetical protein [Candidatus Sumerlaeota bacterium]